MPNLSLVMALLYALTGSTVEGTLRSGDSGEPIPGVLVEAVDCGRKTWTDSAGYYALRDLPSGPHVLRMSRLGYEARTADVIVAAQGSLRVDILLTSRPVPLLQVRIVERRRSAADSDVADAPRGHGTSDPAWRFDDARLHVDRTFGDADVLQTISILPGVATPPEFPTTLHIRGGSSDHNLILLDGVPLYNAHHAAGALTALNPDVISAIDVISGAPSARHGSALAGVVGLETMQPRVGDGVTSRGLASTRAIGQTLSGPLPRGAGTFAISGRLSTQRVLAGLAHRTGSVASFGDLFVKGVVPTRYGDLELFSLTGDDLLAFKARAARVTDATVYDASSPAASSTAPVQNEFAWHTATQAVVWQGRRDASLTLSARAWRTRFSAAADWAATAGPVQLVSGLDHVGLASEVSRGFSSSLVTAGFVGERVRTEYVLRHTGVHDAPLNLLSPLASSRLMATAFLEDEWQMTPRWTLRLGIRDLLGAGQWGDLDPRMSARFVASPGLELTAGYARTHQYVQSLRNEESLVDAVVGIALPMAAGQDTPAANSDAVALSATANLGADASLRLGAYGRHMQQLWLVAPTTAQPFAFTSISHGEGHAAGLTALMVWRHAALSGHAGYSLAKTSRDAAGQQYRPSFAPSHLFNTVINYSIGADMALRAAFWRSTGRRTSLVDGDLQWAPDDLFGGGDGLAGTPERIAGALNAERLPMYARLDLGIRKTWRMSLGGQDTRATGVLTLVNALNYKNALGRVVSGSGRTRCDMPSTPRSLTFRLEWSFHER